MSTKLAIFIIVLCILFSACSIQSDVNSPPPESILYLGGAAILDEFHIEGGPGDPDGASDIIIRTPIKLEQEGFHFAVIGVTEDETQETIYTEDDITPASYLVIDEEIYCDYVKLTLFIDYSWNGTLMSMRIVNLLTLEEQSSVATEFDLNT